VSSYAGYLIETFVTLIAVCGLAFAVLWGARRLGIGRPSGPIELRGHLPLDARRSIYVVKVGAQVFVVGVGEGGFTKLGEIPAEELPKTEPARGAPFADVLAKVLGRTPEGSGRNETVGRTPEGSGRNETVGRTPEGSGRNETVGRTPEGSGRNETVRTKEGR
jgi:flagellar protein FliO/FliZ